MMQFGAGNMGAMDGFSNPNGNNRNQKNGGGVSK